MERFPVTHRRDGGLTEDELAKLRGHELRDSFTFRSEELHRAPRVKQTRYVILPAADETDALAKVAKALEISEGELVVLSPRTPLE